MAANRISQSVPGHFPKFPNFSATVSRVPGIWGIMGIDWESRNKRNIPYFIVSSCFNSQFSANPTRAFQNPTSRLCEGQIIATSAHWRGVGMGTGETKACRPLGSSRKLLRNQSCCDTRTTSSKRPSDSAEPISSTCSASRSIRPAALINRCAASRADAPPKPRSGASSKLADQWPCVLSTTIR